MNLNLDKLTKLNNLVSLSFRRKHIIVLNPNGEEDIDDHIIYDKSEWKIPEKMSTFVDELSKNSQLSNEEKILSIFEDICKEYVYDDNLISYLQKIDDDSYDLPDWYGRDIDRDWEINRAKHNRRVCYEVSRYLAKSLEELFKDNEDFNICILWDKGLTHYFVGLTCDDYSITLDTDDFNNIKDLTRVKTGLTAQDIVILEDNEGKFKNSLEKFNENRSNDAITKIEDEMHNNSDFNIDDSTEEPEDVTFLKNALEILKANYNIDSQGLFEYMKEIIDIKLGPESRKKVWKKLKGSSEKSTRYIRCLVIDVCDKKYIIDVDNMLLREFNEEELEKEDASFIPYKNLVRDWGERYNGL